jgi:hypothetical protein
MPQALRDGNGASIIDLSGLWMRKQATNKRQSLCGLKRIVKIKREM